MLGMKLKTHRSFPSELQLLVAAANARLSASRAVERLWANDHRLWKDDPTDITNRLGWSTVIESMKDWTEKLRTFAASAKKRGIRDVVLLGMGGSSLGQELLSASLRRTKCKRTSKK
jgi:glucose-6-phosphate isomerase/transaldolase/glucose-6-phosphate isomerase